MSEVTDTAKGKADQVVEETRKVTTDVAGSVREVAAEAAGQAGDVVAQARQQVGRLMGESRTELHTQLDTRAANAAAGLHVLSSQLGALGDGRLDEAGPLVGYLQTARQRVQGIAERLDQGGGRGVLNDAAAFARRRPGTFLLGAVLAGFAVGRLARIDKDVSGQSSPPVTTAGDAAYVTTPPSAVAMP